MSCAPKICSGDIYAGVPMAKSGPADGSRLRSIITEIPKSNTLVVTIRPSGSMQTKMFCGLRSHHVGMVDQARGQDFAVKETLRHAHRGQGSQNHLQGDLLAGSFVGSGPYRSHSALAKQVLDPVFSIYQPARLQDRVDGGIRPGFRALHASPSLANKKPNRAACILAKPTCCASKN